MSEYQQKPNTGKVWRTSKEDKQKDHKRLSEYSWYNEKDRAGKAELISQWSGDLLVEIDGQETDFKIYITEGKSKGGKEQMGIRLWQKPNEEKKWDSPKQSQIDDDIPF